MTIENPIIDSPDSHANGLTGRQVDALRYDGHSAHPFEVAGMLHGLMPAGVRVLDVGCGTGSVTLIANRDRNNTIVAVEPDSLRAEVARSRGLDVHVGYLDEIFLARHPPFDVVMAADVLEHTVNPAKLLSLIRKSIHANGIILISVPNVAHWSVRLNLLVGRFDYEPVGIMDATHLRWFTAHTIASLIKQSGFHIMEMRQTAGVDLPIYVRGYLKGFRRGKARLIRVLTLAFPSLFGVQHVIKASINDKVSQST